MAEDIKLKEDLKAFYKATEEFGTSLVKEKSISGLISQGLGVLLQFPSASYASLYLLNQETFEFEFNSVLPDNYQGEVTRFFQKIIDSGSLGKSLQTGSIGFFTDEVSNKKNNYIICPVVASGGVTALVLINVLDNLYPPEHHLYQHVKMFSMLLGISIESSGDV